jgi:hypothetical protein
MENITNTVKEKMQKVYSFTGTQLLVTWLGVVILLSIFACAGRHGWPRGMMNHNMMRWDKWQMMQQYDRQGNNWQQRQDMMRGQWNDQSNRQNQQPMMNSAASAEQPTANQSQPTPPSAPAGTGN